jgi:hypothetical protein
MPWIEDNKIEKYLEEQYAASIDCQVIGFGTATKLIVMWLYFITKLLNIIIERMDEK